MTTQDRHSILTEDRALNHGLERWRVNSLQQFEEDMLELTEDFRATQDGLGISHRNPGEVRPDIIEYLWEKLNRSATDLERIEPTEHP